MKLGGAGSGDRGGQPCGDSSESSPTCPWRCPEGLLEAPPARPARSATRCRAMVCAPAAHRAVTTRRPLSPPPVASGLALARPLRRRAGGRYLLPGQAGSARPPLARATPPPVSPRAAEPGGADGVRRGGRREGAVGGAAFGSHAALCVAVGRAMAAHGWTLHGFHTADLAFLVNGGDRLLSARQPRQLFLGGNRVLRKDLGRLPRCHRARLRRDNTLKVGLPVLERCAETHTIVTRRKRKRKALGAEVSPRVIQRGGGEGRRCNRTSDTSTVCRAGCAEPVAPGSPGRDSAKSEIDSPFASRASARFFALCLRVGRLRCAHT